MFEQLLSNGKSKGQNPSDDMITNDLILSAMNNSFVKQMSDGNDQTIDDLLSLLNLLAMSLIKKDVPDITVHKYYIVELDQKVFTEETFFSKFTCGNCSSSQIDRSSDIPPLQPFCLVFNLENRELHFQSLTNSERKLFINLDTVPCYLNQVQAHSPFRDQLISLQVDKKMKVDMYLTKNICPFPFSVFSTDPEKEKYARQAKVILNNLLKKSIEKSRGKQLSLRSVLKYEDQFSQRQFATQEQFANYCESGDVLLFRDNHTFAKLQRVVTNSEYDHVGVVYKHPRYGICLFESNSKLGVAMIMWNQLIKHKWFQNIERITWRKLQVHKKPADFEEKITDFVRENLNKKFSLTATKLLKDKVVSHEDKTTYFCSELVATLYRYLGLLDPNKGATQYWPKDFSNKGQLNILNGSLDPERQIVFEDALLSKNYPFYK